MAWGKNANCLASWYQMTWKVPYQSFLVENWGRSSNSGYSRWDSDSWEWAWASFPKICLCSACSVLPPLLWKCHIAYIYLYLKLKWLENFEKNIMISWIDWESYSESFKMSGGHFSLLLHTVVRWSLVSALHPLQCVFPLLWSHCGQGTSLPWTLSSACWLSLANMLENMKWAKVCISLEGCLALLCTCLCPEMNLPWKTTGLRRMKDTWSRLETKPSPAESTLHQLNPPPPPIAAEARKMLIITCHWVSGWFSLTATL